MKSGPLRINGPDTVIYKIAIRALWIYATERIMKTKYEWYDLFYAVVHGLDTLTHGDLRIADTYYWLNAYRN